ncbi:MAG: M4 family metallopeptidase [Saprospiraceae bacterium]|nr:M4 family metallopeptidase [Saprospiraceae bacterium]
MKYIFLFLFLLVALGSEAQFKKILFNKDVKISSKDIWLEHIRPTSESTNRAVKVGVDYNSISANAFIAEKSGLRAGFLNSRYVPTYIEGALRLKNSRSTMSTQDLAIEYLSEAAPMMKIKDVSSEFDIKSIFTDELGITHVKCQQVIKNIPVFGAEIIIHGKGETFDFLNGNYFPSFNIEKLEPSISIENVMEACMADMGEMPLYDQKLQKIFGGLQSSTELVIYPNDGNYILAYHITTYKNLMERWEYFIDANNGEIIHKYQSICKFHNHKHKDGSSCGHSETNELKLTKSDNVAVLDGKATATATDLFNVNRLINTYEASNIFYLIDGSRDIFSSGAAQLPDNPEGVIWTIDAFNSSPQKNDFNYDHVKSSNNIWNNKTGVSAHYNGGKAFEYFRLVHNRKSINGEGGNIVSLINVADEDGSSMGNAFWNGAAMFYGNGDSAFLPLARGLDVAGHEMTHGVVQSTANLEYEGESGALNESFADVFGVLIDRDDWKIGEDVVKTTAFPSGALRDMQDPHNGAATNDFNNGWQPKIYSERYKGSEDNGGVHLNSGIPNHAFFLFATAVGKDKAEKVYYRALSTYLTKSSKFVDCRVAVVKAATDLYTSTEVNAAKKAFTDVGILGDEGGSYEVDNQTNPGAEFILSTSATGSGLTLHDSNGTLFKTLSSKGVKSKPSISDNGSEIVFVGTDDKINYIFIDWTKNPISVQENVIGTSPIWRNAIISKDGFKIGALKTDETNEIIVFDFSTNPATSNVFTLYNPTFSEGISTGDVNFADAMEFDVSGEYIMYDAENEIKSNTSGSIIYWDISFIKVWNNESNTYSLGKIEKLYTSLPEEVSIGNPTFSKNSPYIIAFDYIDPNGESIYGANIERGESKLIYSNDRLGYPNYSSKDNKIVFDTEGQTDISTGVVNLKSNKIEKAADPTLFLNNRRWTTWFSNGKRDLSNSHEETEIIANNIDMRLAANPVSETVDLNINSKVSGPKTISISDSSGKILFSKRVMLFEGINTFSINLNEFLEGQFVIFLSDENSIKSIKFVKVK